MELVLSGMALAAGIVVMGVGARLWWRGDTRQENVPEI